MPNTDYFKLLNKELFSAEELSKQKKAKGFLGQEILRFHTIAGTLIDSDMTLDKNATVTERHITHPLIRTLLENFFKILYIFNDSELESDRFEKAVNGFKEEYRKLFNDLSQEAWEKKFMKEYRDAFQPAKEEWKDLPKLINTNDILVHLKNNHGDSLQFLYVLYRITSFDIHGNSLKIFFDETFDTQCNFPIIDIKYALNLIASTYVELLNKHTQPS